MTNPNDAVGTNAGFNGRTTPNAFNDVLATLSRGVLSGWACSPKSGMTIQLGGDGSTRDVAIAEDNAGNRTTINNRLGTPVEITLGGAPATGNRIDSIVAYVENPQSGAGASDVDFPSQVGIIAVQGTASGSPSAPSEATIRTAITADGATGSSAYYVVLANITVGQGVTTIGSGVISAGAASTNLSELAIANGSITTNMLAANAVTSAKLDNSGLFKASANLSGNVSIPASTKTTVQTLSLPAGTWRISWGVRAFGASQSGDIVYGGLTVASSDAQSIAVNANQIGGTFRCVVSSVYDATLTGTTTIATVLTMPAGYASPDGCYLKAIRIA